MNLKRALLPIIAGFYLGLSPSPGIANVRVLPRAIEDFQLIGDRLHEVETVWVEGSKLAWVNYEALKRDFPKLEQYSNSQIDQLLILNFSYISKFQIALNGIRNTLIPADLHRTKKSFRPTGYGRADVIEFLDFDGSLLGLIDRKGSGVSKGGLERNLEALKEVGSEQIQTKDHSDGLATLGESIVETTRERARRRLYQVDKTGAETVESYFVLLFPFHIMKGNGSFDPAGVYARQAHLGHMQTGFQTPLPKSETSAVQQDYFGAGFDQGLIRIIDPRLQTTFGAFGNHVKIQQTPDWVWAHETANAFVRSGDRSSVDRHMRDMTAPLDYLGEDSIGTRLSSARAEVQHFFKSYPNSPNFRDRALVATAIKKIRSELYSGLATPQRLIEKILNDESPEVRVSGIRQIKILDSSSKGKYLEKLSRDSDLKVVATLLSSFDLAANEQMKVFRNSIEEFKKQPLDERMLPTNPHYIIFQRAIKFAYVLKGDLKTTIQAEIEAARTAAQVVSGSGATQQPLANAKNCPLLF